MSKFSKNNFCDSLHIKYCIGGTLSLGLAGSGTNKNLSLKLEFLKYRPLDDATPICSINAKTEPSIPDTRKLLWGWRKSLAEVLIDKS